MIPKEARPYYEDAIYMPMLLVVLERDRAEIEVGEFKFKGPYLKVIDLAEQRVREIIKRTNVYFRKHKMKLVKVGRDGNFTEYQFIYDGHTENRRYSNLRLRNRTAELLEYYLMKGADMN